MRLSLFFLFIIVLVTIQVSYSLTKNSDKNVVIDNIVDVKEFKKLLRTKTNVLVLFMNSVLNSALVKVFKDVAIAIKGQGTMVIVNCSGEAKKLCKKFKVTPETHILKHYKDGEFNKDYDRKLTVSSMLAFMKDPTSDMPWEEDITASDVVHLLDLSSLSKFIKKEQKPILIMFYAPWCGFCKTLKPEFAAAATELHGHSVLAAMDCDRPETSLIRQQYNITGFPTLFYFSNGAKKFQYEGENNKKAIISFMHNPRPTPKIQEPEWSDTDSEVVHLTSFSFDPVIKEEASVLVMFYAPWCGHCKKMKPEYEKAAAQMRAEGIPGMLAAIDAMKEPEIASRYSVKGYPTVKYFSYGVVKFGVNVRESLKIVEFMKNPQEPPPPPPPETPWSEEISAVVHLTEDTYKPFLKKKKHVLVMFYAPWCGYCKKAKPEFTEAAEFFKDDTKVEFAAVDCTTQKALCSANDVKGYPTLIYFSYYSKVVKKYSGPRMASDFIAFMQNPESPPAPINVVSNKDSNWIDANSNILVLNDSTFKTTIMSSQPILVMFYAPWCGHCKKLKPQYSKAADELKAEGFGGQFAVLDCTTNPLTTEEYEISGFPTIKLFVKGKYVMDYEGARSPEDLKAFIKNPQASKKKDEL